MTIKPVRKAVFPVAGIGTRMLPATKSIPKEMLSVNDRPLIQYVLEEAQEAGIEEFIFVTGRSKSALEEHFDSNPDLEKNLEEKGKHDILKKVKASSISSGSLFVTRQHEPLGLGHAIWCASKLVGNEPFAILLPDVLVKGQQGCLRQMMDVYNRRGGNVIAVEDVPREKTSSYGIVDTGGNQGKIMDVHGLVEKPKPEAAPSTLSVIGRYILQPEIFTHLAEHKTGAGGEIQLTDAMEKLIGTQPFYASRFAGKSYDCGNPLGLVEANIVYALSDDTIRHQLLQIIKEIMGSAQNSATYPRMEAAA